MVRLIYGHRLVLHEKLKIMMISYWRARRADARAQGPFIATYTIHIRISSRIR
jgi:hypothetical protein